QLKNQELSPDVITENSCAGGRWFSGCESQLILLAENGVSDVRPEFFDYIEGPIQRQLLSPSLPGLGPGAIWGGVVQSRDSRGGAIPDDFRIVDLRAAAIGARN